MKFNKKELEIIEKALLESNNKKSKKLLNKINKPINKLSKKEKYELAVIKSIQHIFDKYENLTQLPYTVWGRYYKYECSGEDFISYIEEDLLETEYGIELLEHNKDIIYDENLDLREDFHNLIHSLDSYCESYANLVKYYDCGDGSGGVCLMVVRDKNNNLNIELIPCDSPE